MIMNHLRPLVPSQAKLPITTTTQSSCLNPIESNSNSGDTITPITHIAQKPIRKRTVLGKPTLVACTECRTARSKCDGHRPSCSRCIRRGLNCVYNVHTKLQKDEILKELEQSKIQTANLLQENENLRIGLDDTNNLDKQVITKTVRSSLDTYATGVENLGQKQYIDEAVEHLLEGHGILYSGNVKDRISWNCASTNIRLLDYLIDIFFQQSPNECFFLDKHKLTHAYKHGNTTSCSVALLNAICGISCSFLLGETPSERHQTLDALNLLKFTFIAQAEQSVTAHQQVSVPAIQTMLLLFLAHLCDGKAQLANGYLTCTWESISSFYPLNCGNSDLEICQAVSFFLHSLWLGKPPTYLRFPPFLRNAHQFEQHIIHTKFVSRMHKDYTNDDVLQWEHNTHIVVFQARLAELYHDTLRVYYGVTTLDGVVTGAILVKLHEQISQCMRTAPTCIQTTRADGNHLHVSTLHMIYHGISACFWLPLLAHAQAQLKHELIKSLRHKLLLSTRAGLQQIKKLAMDPEMALLPPYNMMWLVNICDCIARWTEDPSEQEVALKAGLQILVANRRSARLCQSLATLFLAEAQGFAPQSLVQQLRAQYGVAECCTMLDALNATARTTYLLPLNEMVNCFHPDVLVEVANTLLPAASSNSRQALRIPDLCC